MKYSEITTVRFLGEREEPANEDTGKFILATYGNGEEQVYLLRLGIDCQSHDGLEDMLSWELRQIGLGAWLMTRGGGRFTISISEEMKKISVCGQSGSFGWPDYDIVIRLLTENFPGWTIQKTDGPELIKERKNI